jgi:hypothetical protein
VAAAQAFRPPARRILRRDPPDGGDDGATATDPTDDARGGSVRIVVGALVAINAALAAALLALVAARERPRGSSLASPSAPGLVVANLLTLGVGAALRWDQNDSKRSIRELEEAKYRHKSL